MITDISAGFFSIFVMISFFFIRFFFGNAFAYRGTHKLNLECLKKSFDWFNCDIYAETQHKTAILCLFRCGFKKVGNNLYKYER